MTKKATDYTKFIKTKKLPGLWCVGCSIPALLHQSAKAFLDLKFNNKNTVLISGIGCTGRIAGYFDLDSVHTIHGRVLPVAEGVKSANPKLNVVVISGDGDLISMGGNHLLNTSRRNPDITAICYNNEIYGLTGGQMSPETRKGNITITSPKGAMFNRLNVQGVLISNEKYFYGRTSIFDMDHLNKVIKSAIKHKGFSFVEVMGYCFESDGRRRGFKNVGEMVGALREKYKIVEGKRLLGENELGIVRK